MRDGTKDGTFKTKALGLKTKTVIFKTKALGLKGKTVKTLSQDAWRFLVVLISSGQTVERLTLQMLKSFYYMPQI